MITHVLVEHGYKTIVILLPMDKLGLTSLISGMIMSIKGYLFIVLRVIIVSITITS